MHGPAHERPPLRTLARRSARAPLVVAALLALVQSAAGAPSPYAPPRPALGASDAGAIDGADTGSDAGALPGSAPALAPGSGVGPLSGPSVTYATRPPSSPSLRACSARAPICVHPSSTEDASAALATLDAFERAWETLTGALAIPPPDVDPTTLRYDVFLVDPLGGRELATTHVEARDVRSRVDRARAFTLVDRRVRRGCVLDALAAEAIARASLLRAAPATEEGTARAQATYLAELAAPCAAALAVDAAHAFQSRPERAFFDARAGERAAVPGQPSEPEAVSALFAAGAAAFWARLDWAYGRSPGGIIRATWALHPTMTAPGAARWDNEPDTLDVLRATFDGALSTRGSVHDLFLDFAVARAFFGSADDGLHHPESRTLGDAARVPVDWDVPWPATPRRLAQRAPVWPTGASYLVIRREGAARGARLRAEIEWEEHALFRWAFVKLDASGRELGRVVIPTPPRATSAQMTLVDLDAADRVLLVGVNLGDPAHELDPDDEVWEPHGWLVTLAAE